MSESSEPSHRIDPSLIPLMRSLGLELVIYAPIVTLYYLFVLRRMNTWLTDLFNTSTIEYAAVAILLVVVQGVSLEILTSWLLRRIGLRQ